jgi:ATP-dependent exoDNAse (exonuclease V) alpha subunit
LFEIPKNQVPELSRILQSKFPYQPTEGQVQFFKAVDELMPGSRNQLDTLVVRGYAGTGKTTAISALVSVLPLFNTKFTLLAPTGRAAKVISTYAGKKAFTIHKIIYKQAIDSKTGALRFVKRKNYAKKTVFIVDEASLISDEKSFLDSGLLSDLVAYVFEHPGNRLILSGDNAQLPPVGSGMSPALDLQYLKSRFGVNVHEVELAEVLRQAQDSGILYNATNLRAAIFNRNAAFAFKTGSYGDIFRMTHNRLEEGIRYAFDKFGMDKTAIVCRSNWQAVRYNEYIRRSILFRDDEIEVGDVIMVVRNNYAIIEPDSEAGFLANGEFAEIRKILSLEDAFGLRFADVELQLIDYPDMAPFQAKVMLDTLHCNTASLTAEQSDELYKAVMANYQELRTKKKIKEALQKDVYLNALQIKYAYALTCHKSQGGQWDVVFIDQGNMPQGSAANDNYRWLYTAITRSAREVYLLNFESHYFEAN